MRTTGSTICDNAVRTTPLRTSDLSWRWPGYGQSSTIFLATAKTVQRRRNIVHDTKKGLPMKRNSRLTIAIATAALAVLARLFTRRTVFAEIAERNRVRRLQGIRGLGGGLLRSDR